MRQRPRSGRVSGAVLEGKGKAVLGRYKQEGENELGEPALFELTSAGLPGSLSGPAPPWSGTQFWYPQPSQPSQPSPVPFLARAAAANVNPRTRLSHVTEIPLLLGS